MTAPVRPPLTRDAERGIVAGVCAGIGRRYDVDPVLPRIGFAVVTIATAGAGALAYAIAWLLIPAGDSSDESRAPRLAAGGWRVAAGAGLLALAGLLAFRELGIWWSDALVWPLVLASAGAALLWRQSRAMQPSAAEAAPSATAPAAEPGSRLLDLYRGGFGVALVVGAALLFLSATDALGSTREVVLATVAGVMALALILAPFLWRLGANLAAERAERIRSQERADLAAHLHDSVLQTLTLIQKHAGEPREVATLARRQERELREWLFAAPDRPDGGLAAAIEAAAAAVEDARGVAIEVVTVGDLPLDERREALVAATREALTNAAKFAGEAGPIAVYAEMEGDGARVFVRDRGSGFDPAAVPADRRGVSESIIGRMERYGGRATVDSAPGHGTEVALELGAAR